MGIVEAIILAIVEGLTEFLPVSSTGHMIITSSLMGIAEDDFTKSFIVQIQFGTILSVVVLYFKRFFKSLEFYMRLFLAFIPAAILGFLFADMIDALLENVIVVAISLLVGGIFLLFVDRIFKANETAGKDRPDFMNSFVIGLFQVLAMIPGVSRSAATIVGGMTQKLNRKAATEFSFFLAVPTMFAATGYKLYKSFDEGPGFTGEEVGLLALGNVVGFIVALFAIRFFIGFVTKNGFKIFGIYRILLGLIIIVLSLAGYNLSIV